MSVGCACPKRCHARVLTRKKLCCGLPAFRVLADTCGGPGWGRRRGGGGGGGRRRGSREQRRRARGCRGRQAEKDEFHERQWLGRPQVGSSLLSCRAHPLPLRSGRLSDSSPAFFSMSSPVTRRLAISSPHWSLRAPRQNQPPAARGEACATSALPGNARLLADAENASDQTRRPRSGPEPPRPRC